MKLRTLLASLAILTLISGVAYAAGRFSVTASEFDPARTFLVQAEWLDGIGCPTNAGVSADGATFTSRYTDPACTTGDTSDGRNQGLLLAKTGPTANFAAAGADITGVKGMMLTELGYDIRKPDLSVGPRGSHCGAGAPRFNITTQDGNTYFIGCNSPPAVQTLGNGWLRLRWGAGGMLIAFGQNTGLPVNISSLRVQSMEIVFDEGQDTGPDNFGLAVIDNIDVNRTLVGRGDNAANNGKKDKNKDKDHGERDNGDSDEGDDD